MDDSSLAGVQPFAVMGDEAEPLLLDLTQAGQDGDGFRGKERRAAADVHQGAALGEAEEVDLVWICQVPGDGTDRKSVV